MGGSLRINNGRIMQSLESMIPNNSVWQKEVWNRLLLEGFPDKKHNDWKYTSLDDIQDTWLTPAVDMSCDSDIMDYINTHQIPIESYRLVIINGRYSVRHSSWIPQLVVHRLDSVLSTRMAEDSTFINPEFFAKLTDATCTSGLSINIPAKLKIDKPLYVLFFETGYHNEISSSRTYLNIGRDAEVTVLEHHLSSEEANGVTLSRLSTQVADNAQCAHINIIDQGNNHQHFGHNDFSLGRNSKVNSKTFIFNGRLIRHNTSSQLNREGGELHMDSLALPTDEQTHDTRTFLRHSAPHCQSRQLHKIIGSGKGNGVFDGMINVDPQALKTDGQMDNHNLLLNEQVSINSRPKLEIYADDVKCSHGATTGQLNPDEVFYLQARGIAKPLAKKIITAAFANEVCLGIQSGPLATFLQKRIASQLEV